MDGCGVRNAEGMTMHIYQDGTDSVYRRKQELRRYMLNLRNSLSRADIIGRSDIIQGRVLMMDEFNSSSIVGLYSPIGSEVDTSALARYLLEHGRVLAYPRIHGREMVFARVVDPVIDLTMGRYGILEPSSACEVVEPDLILVPGLVWDEHGYRIGYGKGYYDRYIRTNPDAVRIGVAYDFQVLSSIPHSEEDARVCVVLTERRVIRVE
ncbi:MAG: 5-formyltetrahydrofolate cyclo-ligase [Candidatus Nitrosocaldus sp.]|nr:5-formyltetrahydrofolate cyclo-ligase [Candidatus Nitrosocaldus sp.]MDW7999602.1 5-formyltetrahydrofolate cyclo-ligase [Candidatus Nitrosocaldus sp.]